MALATESLQDVVGKSPDRLTLGERTATAGKWIALEVYTPETLPLRVIEALGDTAAECIRKLEDRGLNPRTFEFSVMPAAF